MMALSPFQQAGGMEEEGKIKILEKVKMGNLEVEVTVGNLLDEESDVVVCPSNRFLIFHSLLSFLFFHLHIHTPPLLFPPLTPLSNPSFLTTNPPLEPSHMQS